MKQSNKHSNPIRYQPQSLRLVAASDETHNRHSPNRRITADSPEDILAYIQCTLGFVAKDSLVVVAFDERQLSTVVRCDLPESIQRVLRSGTPESVMFMDFGLTEAQELQLIDIGRQIGGLLAREPSTTSCFLLYLSENVTVSDQQALAVTGTANSMIAAQFGLQRMPVKESWFIHHNRLWHLRCGATLDCTVQGQPVGNPENTKIFRSLDPEGTTRGSNFQPAPRLRFPPASMSPRNELSDTQHLLEHNINTVLSWLELWDQHLRTGPQMLHSDEVAEMLESLEHRPIFQAVQALACFDLSTAINGMVMLGQFPMHLLTSEEQKTSVSDALRVEQCMTGESQDAPDWLRIKELERLCHQLLPLSDANSGGAVAGLLVWIEWVRGRGSIAMSYVRAARKRFPAEQVLQTLEGFLNQGLVATWATRLDSAWTPQHAG